MGEKFEIDSLGVGELSPGSTPRRYVPEKGLRKHNERIHRESKYADSNKNLPFSFRKPRKSGRQSLFECPLCGYILSSSVNTVGFICSGCKKFVNAKEVV
jgi:hypothetical protein